MKQLKKLWLLALSWLLLLPLSTESFADCPNDTLYFGQGVGFSDGDQQSPGMGSGTSNGFSDGDQSNPTMGEADSGSFSDADMAGGSGNKPNPPSAQKAYNVIYYTSTDGKIVMPNDAKAFGMAIVSNAYENGQGKLTFDDDVTIIGEEAFLECLTLATIRIPDKVVEIGGSAFEGCEALEAVTIPASVTTIGKYAFDGCDALADVTNLSMVPQELSRRTFSYYGNLHVLEGCKASYMVADYWKNFFIMDDASDVEPIYFNDGEAYAQLSSVEVELLVYSRTFTNANWQALYVPFEIPVDTLTQYGMEVAKLNDTHMYDWDEDGVFEEVTVEFLKLKSGMTKANHPYLVKASEAGTISFTLKDAMLEAAAETSVDCSTIEQQFTFTGIYSGVGGDEVFANNYYFMSGGKLCRAANENVNLKPQRWYMTIENRDHSDVAYYAPSMRLMVDGKLLEPEATGIERVTTIAADATLYTLDGRKVMDGSPKPGMYVQNGKKLIIK